MKLFGTQAMRAGSLAITLAAFAILSAAPNNSARSGSLPDFGSLSVGAALRAARVAAAPDFDSLSESAQSAVAFSHDAKGLENQYQPFLDAFAAVKPADFHAALEVFALPNPNEWFAKHFAKDQVEQLVRQNEAELKAYEQALLKSMAAAPPGTRFHVRCKIPHPDPTIHMQPRAGASVPIADIAVEHFVCEFSPAPKQKNGRFSMYVNYVYVNGSFRYIGTGAYPFWSAPEEAPSKSHPATSPEK